MLLPSIVFDEAFHSLELENKTIDFYTLIPLYSEEVKHKLKHGAEALFEGFEEQGVSDVLDLNRTNTVKRKKFLGIF
jgi:Suppressor of fused protein (SUFU)